MQFIILFESPTFYYKENYAAIYIRPHSTTKLFDSPIDFYFKVIVNLFSYEKSDLISA